MVENTRTTVKEKKKAEKKRFFIENLYDYDSTFWYEKLKTKKEKNWIKRILGYHIE